MYSRRICIALLVCLLVGGGWCLSGKVIAQQARPAAAKADTDAEAPVKEKSKNLWLRKIDWRSTAAKVKAPEYTFRNVVQNTAKTIPEWHMITVTYDTAPDWTDRVVVNYHVLLLSEKKEGAATGRTARPATKEKEKEPEKATAYTLLEGTVSYVDVPQTKGGQSHAGTIFIRPNTIERCGDPVAVGIEITNGEETVAKNEFSSMSKLSTEAKQSGKWWSIVAKSDKVTVRSDCLLNRSQTPFMLVNYLDEETIQ